MQDTQFKWKKYGDYAIITDGYSIAKLISSGKAKYALFEMPSNLIGFFDNPQDAKNEAMAHYRKQPTQSNREAVTAKFLEKMGGYDNRK
jgi:hypothetical protein